MKHRTSELEGALLDAAVALAMSMNDDVTRSKYGCPLIITSRCLVGHGCKSTDEFEKVFRGAPDHTLDQMAFHPSSRWADGGPIIERELINLVASMNIGMMGPLGWSSTVGAFEHYIDEGLPLGAYDNNSGVGPLPLLAAMRAFVAAKMGDEVEL